MAPQDFNKLRGEAREVLEPASGIVYSVTVYSVTVYSVTVHSVLYWSLLRV